MPYKVQSGLFLSFLVFFLFDCFHLQKTGIVPIPLTAEPFEDFHPSWSPDGKFILFDRQKEKQSDVYMVNSDGTGLKALTRSKQNDDHPKWFGDSRHILYESECNPSLKEDLYRLDIKDLRPQLIASSPGVDGGGVIAGDNKQIAFLSDRAYGNYNLYVIESDGSRLKELSHTSDLKGGPNWSPDGKKILLMEQILGHWIIKLYQISDSSGRELTDRKYNSIDPCWSPDGESIAFFSDMSGGNDLFLIKGDGGNKKMILSSSPEKDYLCWSPDGTKLAFISGVEKKAELFILSLKDFKLKQLTHNDYREAAPAWSPDGKFLVYAGLSDSLFHLFKIEVP